MGAAPRAPYEDHAEAVIRAALRELGLTEGYLRLRLRFEAGRPARWSADQLSIDEWVTICQVLCLHIDSISGSYDRRWHLAGIRAAIQARTIDLPRTRQLRAILRELRRHDWENWRFESRHYGFRLRWRIRLRRSVSKVRQFPQMIAHWWRWMHRTWSYNTLDFTSTSLEYTNTRTCS